METVNPLPTREKNVFVVTSLQSENRHCEHAARAPTYGAV